MNNVHSSSQDQLFTNSKGHFSFPMQLTTVKHLPTMQVTRVQSLGREDPLEKAIATHSSILAWKVPQTEAHGGLQSMGVTESRTQLIN